MNQKIYLIGPTLGKPGMNRERFSEVAKALRDRGHSVANPHEVFDGVDVMQMNRRQFMGLRICQLVTCTHYLHFENYIGDRDAELETLIARNLEVPSLSLESVMKGPVLKST